MKDLYDAVHWHLAIPARRDRLEDLLAFVGGAAREAGMDEDGQNAMLIAAEEIFINIASYSYPGGEGEVRVRLTAGPDIFEAEFRDGGTPYDPLARPDPDTSLPVEEREIGGLGIFIVKKLTDHAEYRYENSENILLIRKKL